MMYSGSVSSKYCQCEIAPQESSRSYRSTCELFSEIREDFKVGHYLGGSVLRGIIAKH